MSQRGVQLDRETFSCPVCLELLKEPVTIQCGHSYCMKCINTHWDGEDEQGNYSCPQCRKTLRPRPVLEQNAMLAALVEELKKAGLQAAPADHHFAGPEDVSCDACTGRKRKALKSCLVCPASYCDTHLQPHYDAPPLKKHKLVEPSKDLQENMCSRHDEATKLFCRTDQQLICYYCFVAEHKGHDTVPAAAERTEKQKELEVCRLDIQQRIRDKEKDVEMLQQELDVTNASADKTLHRGWQMFDAVARLVHSSRNTLHRQIRTQQKHEEIQAQVLQEMLKEEIGDLKRKSAELKELSDTPHDTQFLHSYPSSSALRKPIRPSRISIHPRRHFERVVYVMEKMKESIQDSLNDHWESISYISNLPEMLLSESEPKTRDELLRYSRDITLDPNTVFTWLVLSDGDKKITRARKDQLYPDHPDRFTSLHQALSRERLTGRCYWEVEWTGSCTVAVSYQSISRTVPDSGFGVNDKSWSFDCSENGYVFSSKAKATPVFGPQASRIGVYLDHRAGILSLYDVSDTLTLLHRVQTRFTEPLLAGLGTDVSVEICKQK